MTTSKSDEFEEWEDFVKNKLPEFDIQKGSTFEANLYLAFNEMRSIFTQKEYRLKYKIEILTKASEKLILSAKSKKFTCKNDWDLLKKALEEIKELK